MNMWKWILRLVLILFVGTLGYSAYDSYRGGYFDMPEFSETSYAISFKNGLRGIVVDPEITESVAPLGRFFRRLSFANPDRRYLGVPMDVAPWFQDTWSYCHPPTDEERAGLEQAMSDEQKQRLLGARFEAICKIDADGESIWRGLIFSVPKQ
jgi:hypothetical protein